MEAQRFGFLKFEMADTALSAIELGLARALAKVEARMGAITDDPAGPEGRAAETAELADLLMTSAFLRRWTDKVDDGKRGVGSFVIRRGEGQSLVCRVHADDSYDLHALFTVGLSVALAWRNHARELLGDPRITEALGAAMYAGISEVLLNIDDQLDGTISPSPPPGGR